jgi:hypothetical protein
LGGCRKRRIELDRFIEVGKGTIMVALVLADRGPSSDSGAAVCLDKRAVHRNLLRRSCHRLEDLLKNSASAPAIEAICTLSCAGHILADSPPSDVPS